MDSMMRMDTMRWVARTVSKPLENIDRPCLRQGRSEHSSSAHEELHHQLHSQELHARDLCPDHCNSSQQIRVQRAGGCSSHQSPNGTNAGHRYRLAEPRARFCCLNSRRFCFNLIEDLESRVHFLTKISGLFCLTRWCCQIF